MKALILAALTLVSTQALAGASNEIVACKSADGKVTLNGNVPGDFAEFRLEAKFVDRNGRAQEVKHYSELEQREPYNTVENARITVIQDEKVGVYALKTQALEGQTGTIELYAIPSTMKVSARYHKKAFKGKTTISTKDDFKMAEVICTVEYSI